MQRWMMQIVTGLSLVVTLGVSSTAQAYSPRCVDVCTCTSPCDTVCYEGSAKSSCTNYGVSACDCTSLRQVSLPQKAQEQQGASEQRDTSQNVCRAG